MSDLQCAARLLIARHGEAEYESPLRSDAGGSLSLTGRKQAEGLAASLANARVSAIYCSGLVRAVQTAEIVAARLGVVVRVRDQLRERDADDHDARLADGESADEIRQRMAEELEAIVDLHRGETVLVISHGGAIRVAVPHLAANLADNFGTVHEVDNCAVVEMDADADAWVVRSWAGEPV